MCLFRIAIVGEDLLFTYKSDGQRLREIYAGSRVSKIAVAPPPPPGEGLEPPKKVDKFMEEGEAPPGDRSIFNFTLLFLLLKHFHTTCFCSVRQERKKGESLFLL